MRKEEETKKKGGGEVGKRQAKGFGGKLVSGGFWVFRTWIWDNLGQAHRATDAEWHTKG